MVSTINGDSNVPFYKELGNAGLKAIDVLVVAFSVGEEELRGACIARQPLHSCNTIAHNRADISTP